VEDNPTNREMLSRRLRRAGFNVLLAADGKQAVELAAGRHPDAIVMDLNMPLMDGWEAARQIKANAETAKIPIIALTAQASPEERRRALQAGCDDYETKPVQFEQLLGKIGALIKLGSGEPKDKTSKHSEASAENLAPSAKHELITPLNQIIGFSEMLMEEVQAAKRLGFGADLKRIHTAAWALLNDINELLEARKTRSAPLPETELNHRIRTPLNDIMGFVEILQEHAFEEGADDLLPDLQKIRTAATDLLKVAQRYLL
ncbi:MAG TPA: response regulator, partial [Verrucomicrobiae bacterium]|nr:response regulator [Verrucomicrobiae bacterium]